MAKKPQKVIPLTVSEIILRGEADIIRQALEARVQIDSLLEEREAAYRKIAELENQISDVVGEDNSFPFPEPPLPVAEFTRAAAPKKKAAAKVETPASNPTEEESEDTEIDDSSSEDASEEGSSDLTTDSDKS